MPVSRGREVGQDSGRNQVLPPLDEINARHVRRALEMAGGKINGPGGAPQSWGFTQIPVESG